jgi:hypothetical protein
MTEVEWVPLRDTATAFPGSCWWDVNARTEAVVAELQRKLSGATVIHLGPCDDRG